MTRQVSRRILQEIQLDKIAAVDRPCQEGAVVTIMKRAEPEADSAEKVRANRVSELRKKLLTAKTGMAVLNTLIAKEFDESKHPRDDHGRFGEGSSDQSGGDGSPKESAGLKESRRKRRLWGRALVVAGLVTGFVPFSAIGAVLWYKNRKSLDKVLRKSADGKSIIAVAIKEMGLHDKHKPSLNEAAAFIDKHPKLLTDDAYLESKAKAAKAKADSMQKARGERGEGARRAGEVHQRRGEHFGPPRPRTGRSNPPKGAHEREDHGPRRGKQSGRRGAALARRGNLEMGATSANVGFGAGRHRKLKRRKRPKHLKGKASFAIKRRPLQKDQIGRVQALIAKSSILLAQCGDVEDRIRKVIGNSAAEYIHDFVNSTNSRFEGKSKQDRIRMALGAYYGKMQKWSEASREAAAEARSAHISGPNSGPKKKTFGARLAAAGAPLSSNIEDRRDDTSWPRGTVTWAEYQRSRGISTIKD